LHRRKPNAIRTQSETPRGDRSGSLLFFVAIALVPAGLSVALDTSATIMQGVQRSGVDRVQVRLGILPDAVQPRKSRSASATPTPPRSAPAPFCRLNPRMAHSSSAATLEVHFKLFGTDGVSLQSQELTKALRSRGWQVHSCASDVPDGVDGLQIPELSYQSEDALELRRQVFQPAATTAESLTERDLVAEIERRASVIRGRVEAYVDEQRIRVLHIRNIMSLPYNLAATLAFYQLIDERTDLFFLLQHHDLYWEGPNARNFVTPYASIANLIASISCPHRVNVAHVLINPIAARALQERTGIHGTVIPDGFDFDREVVAIDEAVFRSRLETLSGDPSTITRDDVVVAMPARIAINKAIELAIQFVAGLETKRAELENAPDGVGARRRKLTPRGKIVLLLPQGEDVEENVDYFNRLVAYAQRLGLTLAYGGRIVVPDRRFNAADPNHFPFYSTYQAVDLVCYPPEHE
jgi:hypothetical protein